ncbi:DUF1566 domain-containing protein [Desulfobulbus sp. F1]|nr:DUF1566 domain-containing protein [Desulfobulbus sp. F1]
MKKEVVLCYNKKKICQGGFTMKKMYLLLGLMTAVTVPSIGSAKLILDIPPLVVQKTDCAPYGCTPCYPGCNNPCVQCNLTCQNYAGCPNGPCYPACADPCQPCTPTSTGGLNDTGITSGANYPTGNNSTCSGEIISAQDCSIGRDVTAGGFNFTKQGDCVKDNVTGLTWSSHQGEATWSDITAKVAAANTGSGLCGMSTGWRVPNLKELLGTVSYHSASNAFHTVFSDTNTSKPYWSGTSASNTSSAWAVSFVAGNTTILSKGDSYFLRLVNGTTPTSSLTDNSDGTVTDSTTKLMWKKCLEGLSGSTCGTGVASTFTWQDALKQPGLVGNFAGQTGWRLPNIKELQSIVDETKSSPAINSTVFPNVPAASQVWSSSPYAAGVVSGGTTYWKSWIVQFASGAVTTPLSRESTLNVRLVRDMQ